MLKVPVKAIAESMNIAFPLSSVSGFNTVDSL